LTLWISIFYIFKRSLLIQWLCFCLRSWISQNKKEKWCQQSDRFHLNYVFQILASEDLKEKENKSIQEGIFGKTMYFKLTRWIHAGKMLLRLRKLDKKQGSTSKLKKKIRIFNFWPKSIVKLFLRKHKSAHSSFLLKLK